MRGEKKTVVTTNCEKSAEAIVLKKNQEGLNNSRSNRIKNVSV